MEDKRYQLEEIESCEPIGEFNEEYVYDVSVNDSDRQTFIANDILVHNSLFVSYNPAFQNCDWQDQVLNQEYLENIPFPFILLYAPDQLKVKHSNTLMIADCDDLETFKSLMEEHNPQCVVIDGIWIHSKGNSELWTLIDNKDVRWNWSKELDFIIGFDKFRYAQYFRDKLQEHADRYGVENLQDFELEKINDSIINLAKKKYIQNIVYEDGMLHKNLSYIVPKGVELVKSSTPLFARDKITNVVTYLLSDKYNIKTLLGLVKELRNEFDLCFPTRIDDISMQTSVNNYFEQVKNDTTGLAFYDNTYFSIKAAAYYNYLLNINPQYRSTYDHIKSGEKIKYYYCKSDLNKVFAYQRGSFPIEFAPPIDLDTQFSKCILSPINGIIKSLNLPEITARLKVVNDIFGGLLDIDKTVTVKKKVEVKGFVVVDKSYFYSDADNSTKQKIYLERGDEVIMRETNGNFIYCINQGEDEDDDRQGWFLREDIERDSD